MVNLPNGIHVSGEGPTVILLHSSLSSSKQWANLVKYLKNDFKVINIDILGYGSADSVDDPDNYSASIEIKRIEQVLTQLLIPDDPYHIVGHSCGGALGLKLAVENPKKILSLSLYEPVAFHLLEENSEAKVIADKFAEKVNVDDLHLAAENFMDYWNEKGFFKICINEYKKQLRMI